MLGSRTPLLSAALAAACLAAALGSAHCTRQHDQLGAGGGGGSGAAGSGGRPSSSTTGGGKAGSGGAGGGAAGAAGGFAGAGAGGSGGQSNPGPPALTVLDGVNDEGAIRICFMPYPGGDPARLPWPSDPAGLAFAHGRAIAPIGAAIPQGTDVRPYILGGDLSLVAGRTCASLIAAAAAAGGGGAGGAAGLGGAGGGGAGAAGAGGTKGAPPLLVAPLPVLPASIFTSPKSVLVVPFGCLDGTHADADASLACGPSYGLGAPTLGVAVVAMTRLLDPAHVVLQVVHADAAMATVDVHLAPGAGDFLLGSQLSAGTVGAPFDQLALVDLTPFSAVLVKTFVQGMMAPTSAVPMSAVFANGNVQAAQVADGKGYALVALGGYPSVAPGPWWHALTYALLPIP